MTTMTDRYIDAVTQHLPGRERADLDRELRGMIADLVEARAAPGEAPEDVATAVLNELGDPRLLAARFTDRPSYLVGPDRYPDYVRLLRTLLSWLPGLVFLLVFWLDLLANDGGALGGSLRALLDAAWTALIVVLNIFFWVTVGFAISERARARHGAAGDAGGAPWTVADLPPAIAKRQISVGDALFGAASTTLLAVVLVVQHRGGIQALGHGDKNGDTVSFFNPDIPLAFSILVLMVIAGTAVFEVAKYAVGYWTPRVAVMEVALSLVWVLLAFVAVWRWDVINPAIARVWHGDVSAWLLRPDGERLIVGSVLVVSAISIWEAATGYLAYRRRSPSAAA